MFRAATSTHHGWPPSRKFFIPISSFHQHGLRLIWPILRHCSSNNGEGLGFLFNCLTTRAVHLEIVPSMDANSCVMGIERFVIEWRFNRSNAPYQGGDWERLVRSFKQMLYTFLRTRHFTHTKVLNTTFGLDKYSLKARPLRPISSIPSNLGSVKTKHFLLGNQATAIPSVNGVAEFGYCKWYAIAQSYAIAISSRWIKEYVLAVNCVLRGRRPPSNT